MLKEFTEKSFTSENQIEKLANTYAIPLLASIPYIKGISEENLLDNGESKSDSLDETYRNKFLCSESFRSLATAIRFLNISDKSTNSLLITSTKPSEGKTTITSLMAKTFADLGNKVLLIDADMRRPSVHSFFSIDNINGLSNLITNSSLSLDEVIINSSLPNLDIITAGIIPPDPVYLLSSKRMDDIFR